MIDDLKPCPLCGGEANAYIQFSKSNNGVEAYHCRLMVGCVKCSIYASEYINSTNSIKMSDFENMYYDAKSALERWNDRANRG